MQTAYRIPDTPHASVKPGETGFKTVPINRMVPRAFVTNLKNGDALKPSAPVAVRGLAMGGDTGVKAVDISIDGGQTWVAATLGTDEGKYSFRAWQGSLPAPAAGGLELMARCTNQDGTAQPLTDNWNPNGFMRNGVDRVRLTLA